MVADQVDLTGTGGGVGQKAVSAPPGGLEQLTSSSSEFDDSAGTQPIATQLNQSAAANAAKKARASAGTAATATSVGAAAAAAAAPAARRAQPNNGGACRTAPMQYKVRFTRAHLSTSRCPPSAASAQVLQSHSQPFSRAHCSTSK